MASTAALEEQHAAALARERSRHRQEVAQLRACRLIRCQNHGTTTHHQDHVEEEGGAGNKPTSCGVVVEHGRESQSETVERWKRLYLEIKTELDDLIESYSSASSAGRERRCCRCSCGAEELRGRLSAMERDAARREREMDILRQSLRILTLTDNNTAAAAAGSRCAPLSLRRLCCLSACRVPAQDQEAAEPELHRINMLHMNESSAKAKAKGGFRPAA